jgi:hypothetical protein
MYPVLTNILTTFTVSSGVPSRSRGIPATTSGYPQSSQEQHNSTDVILGQLGSKVLQHSSQIWPWKPRTLAEGPLNHSHSRKRAYPRHPLIPPSYAAIEDMNTMRPHRSRFMCSTTHFTIMDEARRLNLSSCRISPEKYLKLE